MRRRDDQDTRSVIPFAALLAALDDIDQSGNAIRQVIIVRMKAKPEIIGAQHENNKIQRPVGEQARQQIGFSLFIDRVGICVPQRADGGPVSADPATQPQVLESPKQSTVFFI